MTPTMRDFASVARNRGGDPKRTAPRLRFRHPNQEGGQQCRECLQGQRLRGF